MPSPFPGMDPYLEGHLWADVHHRLIAELGRKLTPALRPNYVARLEVSIVIDEAPESELKIMYPDVGITKHETQLKEAVVTYETPTVISPPQFTLPLLQPIERRLATVEIRDASDNELITTIEVLSPVNKREPGLTNYRQKQRRLHQAGVHLLEIDFLRRGQRSLPDTRLTTIPYVVTLTRAQTAQVEVWPILLSDNLPTVPVPLRDPDPDLPLALGPALQAIYDEAAYDLSIDYGQPPPPPTLAEEEAAWLNGCLAG